MGSWRLDSNIKPAMMAPPRFQCLNATRQIATSGLSSRAAFSTSRSSRSDQPPPRSTTSDLLDLLPGSSPKSAESQPRPSFSNPIQTFAQRKPREIGAGNARLVNLIKRNVDRQNREQSRTRSATTAEGMQNRNLAHDLSEVEMAKWKKRGQPHHDAFDILDLNPEEHYRNFSLISEYMTPMGRIKHS